VYVSGSKFFLFIRTPIILIRVHPNGFIVTRLPL
jgi:hypothetical protein